MEGITPDYWKDIVRGVIYMLLATIMFTTQTSVVKWGHIIGYTAAVILIFRGIIQFICCLFEATIKIDKSQPQRPSIRCQLSRICKDMKHIGTIPRRTIIPYFNEGSALSKSNLLSTDYGSFQSTKSYSCLSPPISEHESASMVNLNVNNCESPPIDTNITNAPKDIMVIHKSQQNQESPSMPLQKPIDYKPVQRKKRRPKYKSFKCLIWSAIFIRGICGGIGTLLLFEASMLLPVGDAQALMALTAAITPFLAFIVFRDTLTKLHLISLVGAIVGVILIIQPPFIFKHKSTPNGDNTENNEQIVIGYIYAISGAIVQALIYICIQFARKVPVYVLTLSQSIWGIITGIIVLLYQNNLNNKDIIWINNWFDAAYVILLGCIGYVFLWLVTASGKYITSGVIALLINLSIVWGYIIQIVIFHQTPTWITIIGAVCMFIAAAIVSMDKISDAKRKSMSVIQRNITTTVGV